MNVQQYVADKWQLSFSLSLDAFLLLAPTAGLACFVVVVFFLSSQEGWFEDKWRLSGQGLDFVDDDEARTKSPLITVVSREASDSRRSLQPNPSLANTVFALHAESRMHHQSSEHSSFFMDNPGNNSSRAYGGRSRGR